MTQHGYFFDGISRGDAVEAPYSADLLNSLTNLYVTANCGYIVPDYRSNFYVKPGAGRTVDVLSGGAFIRGVWFESTATENIAIPENTTIYNRIDMVIIRVNVTNKTADIVLNTGIPSLVPLDPAIKQTDDVYEVPLAKIISVPGFVVVSCTYIYDMRDFILTAEHENLYGPENQMFNGEWMGTAGHGALTNAPAMWEYTNTPTITTNDPFEQQSRGSKLIVTLSSIDTLYTDLVVANDPAVDIPVTIRMQFKVLSGELTIVTDGGLGCTNIHIVETDKLIDLTIRTTYATGNKLVTLIFSNPGTDDCIVELGQIAIVYGYIKPDFSPTKEIILFGGTQDTYGVVASGSATWLVGTFELTEVLKYARGIFVGLRGRDSASAATAAAHVRVRNISDAVDACATRVGRLANDSYRYSSGLVVQEYGYLAADFIYLFRVVVVASGANAFEWDVYMLGITT